MVGVGRVTTSVLSTGAADTVILFVSVRVSHPASVAVMVIVWVPAVSPVLATVTAPFDATEKAPGVP